MAKTLRYRNDPAQDHETPATLYEDAEHKDEGKTQPIHQQIEQLKLAFHKIHDVATAMLNRFQNRPSTKPLCFLP